MDANQRSEFNNQTNNGANEKWNEGATGKSAENGAPLDHTYPQGLGVQQGNQQRDIMGTQGNASGRDSGDDAGIPGGSMDNQINGGSGTVQGITDSHQRQSEQKSWAYGMLEQPVGHRPQDSGVDLNRQRDMGRDDVRGQLPSQSTAQPDLQGGSLGPRGGNLNMQGDTRGNGMAGSMSQQQMSVQMSASTGNSQSGTGSPNRDGGTIPAQTSGTSSTNTGGQEAGHGNTQEGVAGSRTGADQTSDVGGVHESNDVAGGLPRSPGNTGASTDRAGSQTGAGGAEGGPDVHKSNDAAGGYPRSPGFANRLAGDSNMDDDTGFKRK
jgi:hypothetical protein